MASRSARNWAQIAQDLPPQGGYKPIDWKRRITPRQKGFRGFIWGTIFHVTSIVMLYYVITNVRQNDAEIEERLRCCRPLLQAERDRMTYKVQLLRIEHDKDFIKQKD